MTDSVFLSGIKRLEAAFRSQSLSKKSLEIYYEKLSHIEDQEWLEGIENIIENEDFFPSISCLLRYCTDRTYDAAGRLLKYV